MNDHRDESLLDKIKNAFGMGDDGTDAAANDLRDDVPATATASTATVSPEATAPQAGFSEPFEEDLGDPANRPAGPDYGADLEDETSDATMASDIAPRTAPAGYDDPYETGAGPGPMGGAATDGDQRRDRDAIEQEPERRETGI